MPYDPNWFYSSLAQCTGALVGLMGAIVATRLQHQYLEVRESAIALRGHLAALVDDVDRNATHVADFADFALTRLAALDAAAAAGQSLLQVSEQRTFWGGSSSSSSGWGLPTNQPYRERLREEQQIAVLVATALRQPLTSIDDMEAFVATAETLEAIVKEDGPLRQWQNRARDLQRRGSLHARSASVRVPLVITIIVAWLCVVALIVPLWFLSSYDSASKATLLVGFALGVLAIPSYAAYEILRIRGLQKISV